MDPQLAAALHQIDLKVARIKDLKADFRQEKQTPLLKKPLVSTGVLLVKGTRTLWKTQSPEPTAMLIDPEQIRILYPDQKVLEIYPVRGQLGALAASPLPRLMVLEQFFTFKRIGVDQLKPEAPDDQYLAVALTPRDPSLAEHIQGVQVLLERKTGFILLARTLDAGGDRTTLRFTHLQANTGLPDAALDLHVPEGTRISRPLEGTGQ
jgi:outer membrane lipoprotein-sorting protein